MIARSLVVQLLVLIWLAAVWVTLWGEITPADVIGGVVVAMVVMWLLPLPRVPVGGRVHPVSLLILLLVIAYYAVESSIQVAWLSVRRRPPPDAGVLRVELSIKSDLVLVLCADVLNLIPGTMVLEIDQPRRAVFVHVLDVGSPDALDKFHRSTRLLERLFIHAFERPVEWLGTNAGADDMNTTGRLP